MFLMPAKPVRAILAAGLLWSCLSLDAATIINGGNLTTRTWTAAEAPFIVNGDLVVSVGQRLTVEPGVEVRFSSFDAQAAGRDPSRVEMTINGDLDVQGTAASRVVLKGQTANAGSWYGIVAGASSRIQIREAFIHHAVAGLTCDKTGVDLRTENLTVSTNQIAFTVDASAPTLDQVVVFGNQTAVSVGGNGNLSIADSVIYGNTVQAFQINTIGSAVTVDHCTIHGNGTYGFNIGAASTAQVNITSSIISGSAYGVNRSPGASGAVTVTYSDVWGNSSNFVNVVAGANVISEDPLYIDVNGADNVSGNADDNLRLQPNSPCGYAGLNGTDIGAYVIFKLVMSHPEFIGEDARIRFTSVPSRIHELQVTEDFSAWTQVGSRIVGTGAILGLTNFGVKSLPKNFYRVRLND